MSLTPDETLQRVRRSLAEGRLAHAYLLVGRIDAVQEQLVGPWLETLLETQTPFRHPDLHLVRPESRSRAITIDQVRTLISALNQTGLLGGWKVGLILEADRLPPAAANAFLKTLEEPTRRTLILLVTERPDQLLPTILSRCLIVRLHGIPDREPPEAVAPILDAFANPTQRPWIDALYLCREVFAYLGAVLESLEHEADERLAAAKQAELSGAAFDEFEKTLAAQTRTEYLLAQRQLLQWLVEAVPVGDAGGVRLLEEAQFGLHRNAPEEFVWERLFLRRFQGAAAR